MRGEHGSSSSVSHYLVAALARLETHALTPEPSLELAVFHRPILVPVAGQHSNIFVACKNKPLARNRSTGKRRLSRCVPFDFAAARLRSGDRVGTAMRRASGLERLCSARTGGDGRLACAKKNPAEAGVFVLPPDFRCVERQP